MDSVQLFKNAGVLNPAGNMLKENLTLREFEFIEASFKADPADSFLCNAYLIAIKKQGRALYNQGNYVEAILILEKGLAINPNSPEHLYICGRALQAAGQYEAAITAWKNAVELQAGYLEPLRFLVDLLFLQSRLEEALHYARRALNIEPGSAVFLNQMAFVLYKQGHFEESVDYYKQAINSAPDSAEIRSDAARALLILGNLDDGFREYEWRVKKQDSRQRYYYGVLDKPAWQGEYFSGKRLLVHCEQGFGDIIQFVRYLPAVKARGGVVLLSVFPELMRLFSDLDGVDVLVEHSSAALRAIDFDLVIPVMSLAAIFGTTLKTIPNRKLYITADRQLVSQWSNRLPAGGKRVGLVWASGIIGDTINKSCNLAALAPLFNIPGITFYSLQKGDGAKQLEDSQLSMVDMTVELYDFVDTAALVANLDLVITVDTAVAHLAGAMGKHTWVLLPFMADWRWLLEREDSPWYPSIRLFRQSQQGDWESVIAQVAEELVRNF